MNTIPTTRNPMIFSVLVVGLLVPLACPALARKSATDEQFLQQALKICRFRETNFTWVKVNYKKHTFKCFADREKNKHRK